jgi:hypothetical protein
MCLCIGVGVYIPGYNDIICSNLKKKLKRLGENDCFQPGWSIVESKYTQGVVHMHMDSTYYDW